MCEPNAGYKTLAQRGSNRVVAMPSNMLSGRQSEYCGKEVVVTFGGKTVDNLILWDGCAACNSNVSARISNELASCGSELTIASCPPAERSRLQLDRLC